MTVKKKRIFKFRFAPFAAVVTVLTIIAAVYLSTGNQKFFPDIPFGAYTGKISSIAGGRSDTSTLYVERIRNTESLLFVVFKEGWTPQVIPLQRLKAPSKKTKTQYEPVVLSHEGISYRLTGSQDGSGFSGRVLRSGGQKGSWSLRAVSAKELRRPSVKVSPQFDLKKWLSLKASYYTVAKEHRELNKKVEKLKHQEELLTNYLSDEDALRARAEKRKAELEARLHQALSQNKEDEAQLRRHVAEIEQLIRITARGRAIELARRVAKRENKWYSVNWETGADLTALEDSFAQQMNIDLLKLNTNARRAEEIQALRNTISKERARVLELQQIYQQKLNEHRGQPPGSRPPTRPRKQPWWERWDTVFGVVSDNG